MKGYLARAGCSIFALWLAASWLPGIAIEGVGAWCAGAAVIGLGNGWSRTAVVFYRMPLTVGTVALLSLAVNGVALALLDIGLDGFSLSGGIAALAGWLILAALIVPVTLFIGPDGAFRALIPARRRSNRP